MLHLQHKLRYFSFNLFSCHAPSTHQECIILKDFGFLIWWFLCCCFRNFWTCTWKLEGRAAFGLQGCCLKDTVVFWGKNTVQRRRLGITAMPAASQQPQLLLLLLLCFRNWHFSAHYWPSATLMAINRSGWALQPKAEPVFTGAQKGKFTLHLKLVLQSQPSCLF